MVAAALMSYGWVVLGERASLALDCQGRGLEPYKASIPHASSRPSRTDSASGREHARAIKTQLREALDPVTFTYMYACVRELHEYS